MTCALPFAPLAIGGEEALQVLIVVLLVVGTAVQAIVRKAQESSAERRRKEAGAGRRPGPVAAPLPGRRDADGETEGMDDVGRFQGTGRTRGTTRGTDALQVEVRKQRDAVSSFHDSGHGIVKPVGAGAD